MTKPFLVLYATREGQTQRIAEYVATAVRKRGFSVRTRNAAELPAAFPMDEFCAAILAASVHRHKHEAEIVQFVREHHAELERIPTLFLSVSLSEAGAEDQTASYESQEQSAADVKRMIDAFLEETHWRPAHAQGVAGALAYTKYNFLLRFVMKQIARRAGASTDTSRDHEYTDWKGLEHAVEEFVAEVLAENASPHARIEEVRP